MNKIDGFVFDEEAKTTFDWPVRLTPPGSNDSHRVVMTFESVGMEELNDLQEQAEDDGEATLIVKRLVKDWGSNPKATFTDTSDRALPCNDENKAKIFDKIWIAKQTIQQFFEAQGGKKAKLKN